MVSLCMLEDYTTRTHISRYYTAYGQEEYSDIFVLMDDLFEQELLDESNPNKELSMAYMHEHYPYCYGAKHSSDKQTVYVVDTDTKIMLPWTQFWDTVW